MKQLLNNPNPSTTSFLLRKIGSFIEYIWNSLKQKGQANSDLNITGNNNKTKVEQHIHYHTHYHGVAPPHLDRNV